MNGGFPADKFLLTQFADLQQIAPLFPDYLSLNGGTDRAEHDVR